MNARSHFANLCKKNSTAVWIIALYMGSVSVVTTVKWFWFLLSIGALAAVIVALARSFKEASMQRYPEVRESLFMARELFFVPLYRTHTLSLPAVSF